MSLYNRLVWQEFIVRLWRERANGAWRGQIVHLESRESIYFATLAQAEAFIGRFANGIAGASDSPAEEGKHEEPNE